MKRLRVAVIGARGRMGRFACEFLSARPELELVAELGREHDLASALRAWPGAVALDVTVAGLGFAHGCAILEAGARPVIGTSGVSRAAAGELDELARARGLGGIVVPNFSLGMALLNRAAAELAPHFASVTIIERHHETKRDAPSGSARDTAGRLERLRPEQPAIPILSVRAPGLYAHQEVLFGAAGETLTLRHDMLGPLAFGPGLLAAVRYAAEARDVAFGLEVALKGASHVAKPGLARSN
jgi:4-hydroxy-tetrahydrodipicolinate reductase